MNETKPAFMLARALTGAEGPRAVDAWRDTPTRDGWHLDRDTRPWRVWTERTDYDAAMADLERLLAGPPALDAMEAAKRLFDLARTTRTSRTVYPSAMAERLRDIAEGLERGAGAEKQPQAELHRLRDEFRQMADDLATDGGRVNALSASLGIDRILAGGEYR